MKTTPMKRLTAKLKRLTKRFKSLILKAETLETLETLPRIYAHTNTGSATKPNNKTALYTRNKRFKRFMRFITMKTINLKRFNKRFKTDSSVSLPGVPA